MKNSGNKPGGKTKAQFRKNPRILGWAGFEIDGQLVWLRVHPMTKQRREDSKMGKGGYQGQNGKEMNP